MAWLRRISPLFSVSTIGVMVGLSVWAFAVKPEKAYVVAIPATICIAGILVFETRSRAVASRAKEGHRLLVRSYAFFGGALVMLLGPGAKLAALSGLLDASMADTARQLGGLLSGAAFVVFGNFLPKLMSPWRVDEEPFDWQSVHRFSGRVLILAGAVVVWVWLAWPVHEASHATNVAFLLAAAIVITRKFYSLATWRRSTERV